MNAARPDVDARAASEVMKACTGEAPRSVTLMEDELVSTAFECALGDREVIIDFRESNMAFGLTKERFLAEKLRAVGVPTREVVGTGVYGNTEYAVWKKEHGVKLARLNPGAFRAALPSVFRTLLALASVDLDGTEGYGWFGREGVGSDADWRTHLSRVKDEEPGYFFGEWHALFAGPILEPGRFKRYYALMMDLLAGLRPPRSLVHGSFSVYNVLVDDREVAAVRDWQDAKFGDALFDLASLDFWPTGFNLTDLYEDFCAERGLLRHADYRRRIAVCKYYQALGAMIFFAKTNNREAYEIVVAIADGLDTHIG